MPPDSAIALDAAVTSPAVDPPAETHRASRPLQLSVPARFVVVVVEASLLVPDAALDDACRGVYAVVCVLPPEAGVAAGTAAGAGRCRGRRGSSPTEVLVGLVAAASLARAAWALAASVAPAREFAAWEVAAWVAAAWMAWAWPAGSAAASRWAR